MIELMVAIVIIAILAAITLSIGSAVLESADRRKTQDVLSLLDAAMTEYEQHTGRPMTYGYGDGADGFIGSDEPLPDFSRYDIVVLFDDQNEECFPFRGFPEDFSVGPGDFDSWQTEVKQRCGWQVMHEVLERLDGVASCRKILARIAPQFWGEGQVGNSTWRILNDAWGRPIVPVFAGREWYTRGTAASGVNDVEVEGTTNTSLKDMDGTIRTFEERAFGPAKGERIYFMSTGPDGRYGWVNFTHPTGTDFTPDAEDVRYRRTEDNLYSYEVRQW
jgi:type II secretory pathway pseudopilin PulG